MLSIVSALAHELLVSGDWTQEGDIRPVDPLALHATELINIEVTDKVPCGRSIDIEQG
jgi:hypothetical protein